MVVCDSRIMSTDTVIDVLLSTSGAPVSSVIMPRTAGTTTVRVRLSAARALYWCVSSTCRYHSRPPSTTSSARATTYRPYSRLRERGITGPPPSGAAVAPHALREAAPRRDNRPGRRRGQAREDDWTSHRPRAAPRRSPDFRRSARPRPAFPDPMTVLPSTLLPFTVLPITVRRRPAPSQPRRGERRSRSDGAADKAVAVLPRSHPADGERRATGVPAPDSADRPDGADLAASASADVRGPDKPEAAPARAPPVELSQPRAGPRRAGGRGDRRADVPGAGRPSAAEPDARNQFRPGVRTARWPWTRAVRSPAKLIFEVRAPATGNGR